MCNTVTYLILCLVFTFTVFGCKVSEKSLKTETEMGVATPSISTSSPTAEGESLTPTKQLSVVMIIAPEDFRDEEYKVPKKVFESAGMKVVTASTRVGECSGMLGGKANADVLLSSVAVKDYDGIIFVGGVGAKVYFDDPVAQNIAKEAVRENKILAAICIAPVILANAGVLRNKKATSFPSEKETLMNAGAQYTGKDVEVDGNIITASGPQAAEKFAVAIKSSIINKK